MSGLKGQKKGQTLPNARRNKINITVGGEDKKAIEQYQQDEGIKWISTAVYNLVMIGLKKLKYV